MEHLQPYKTPMNTAQTPKPRLYTKDLVRRVTLRLDAPLAEFIQKQSTAAGTTPSEWARMVLHSYMHAVAGVVGLASAINPETSSGKAVTDEDKETR